MMNCSLVVGRRQVSEKCASSFGKGIHEDSFGGIMTPYISTRSPSFSRSMRTCVAFSLVVDWSWSSRYMIFSVSIIWFFNNVALPYQGKNINAHWSSSWGYRLFMSQQIGLLLLPVFQSLSRLRHICQSQSWGPYPVPVESFHVCPCLWLLRFAILNEANWHSKWDGYPKWGEVCRKKILIQDTPGSFVRKFEASNSCGEELCDKINEVLEAEKSNLVNNGARKSCTQFEKKWQ